MNASDFLINHWREMLTLTGQHFVLVAVATSLAVAIGLPLGILLTRRPVLQRPVLGIANVLQTVPSLALFGLLIPLPLIGGIGARTATVALVLYALLPVIRNTVTGIKGVDGNVREAAVAMGLTDRQVLWQVELPLAMSVILAGVRVATVICVGVATIAAAIGAGGLGTYIFRGLRMNDNLLILAGALPAALMALTADFAIGYFESRTTAVNRTSRTANSIRPTRTANSMGAISAAQKQRGGSELEQQRKRSSLAVAAVTLGVIAVALLGAYIVWRTDGNHGGNNTHSATGFPADASTTAEKRPRVVVGSKDFTEQVILGEIVAQMLEAQGTEVERRFDLGGNLCHDALIAGQIDLYPEYTGTSYTAILKHQPISDANRVRREVKREYGERFSVETSEPLGFRSDFAILVRGADARAANLKTISDAVPLATGWRAGFGQDFVSRADGYAGFVQAYDLKFAGQPREMDLSLTYRALASGDVDIIAGNSTDGLIAVLDLVQLEDDRGYFPPYEAVLLARRDVSANVPAVRQVLQRLAGMISTDDMRNLNYAVDGMKRDASEAVREWRRGRGL